MADYVAGAGSRLAKDCGVFRNIDGKPFTRQMLTDVIRSCLKASSIPEVDRYAGHSFCIGAATTAAQQNVAPWLIQAAGRCSSDCFRLYIRTSHEELAAIAASMATES